MNIRQASLDDEQTLYDICVLTGDSGKDARGLFAQSDLLGDIWVGPYLHFSLEFCYVVESGDGVPLGYCIAALDTLRFEEATNHHWWPIKQSMYDKPDMTHQELWSRDERLAHLIHNPLRSPSEFLKEFPSHAHINLVPELQSKGWGKKLMQIMENALHDAGSNGVHLILSSKNLNALAFYKAVGYHIIFERPGEIGVAKNF